MPGARAALPPQGALAPDGPGSRSRPAPPRAPARRAPADVRRRRGVRGGLPHRPVKRLLPATAAPDAARLIGTRAARGFADGLASLLLASYLWRLGFTPVQIGAIATATLFGSAALLLAVGLLGHRFPRRTVLL